MRANRKMEGSSIHLAKHRYSLRCKYKFNHFDLENFCLRFPVLCDKVLNELNPQSLGTCKELSNFWDDQINESRIYWIRKIQIYTEDFNQYKEDWTIFETKTPLETLKDLATALYVFRNLGKEDWKDYKTSLKVLNMESDEQWSPLHIAAMFSLELFKEIAFKFKNINPANNNGETPLHSAVKCGHLDICKFILENMPENKNPEDAVGFTPLHYAAILDNLEIFKFIVQNVENANHVKGSGISPFHCAHHLGKREVFKFIEEKYNDASKINYDSFSKEVKFKISILYLKALGQNRIPVLTYKQAQCEERLKISNQLLAEKIFQIFFPPCSQFFM